MIKPEFLAELRERHRAETILLMVQLEQIIPCWHASITDLALQLRVDRSTLNHNLLRLKQLELLEYYSITRSGCWVWWIKRSKNETPNPANEPGWILNTLVNRQKIKIPISKRKQWAKTHQIPLHTLYGFLNGRQNLLRNQWQVVASPFDVQIK